MLILTMIMMVDVSDALPLDSSDYLDTDGDGVGSKSCIKFGGLLNATD